jgi:hypothetical protein
MTPPRPLVRVGSGRTAWEVVARPNVNRLRDPALYEAILATLEQADTSVRIEREGRSIHQIVNPLHSYLWRRGLSLRYRPDGDAHVRVWVEKRKQP